MSYKPIGVGDLVAVKKSVKNPFHGWGEANHDTVGPVKEVDGDSLIIDFPCFHLWHGLRAEMKRVKSAPKETGDKEGTWLGEYPCNISPQPYVTIPMICKLWKLPVLLSLSSRAAEFYTLIDLELDAPDDEEVSTLLKRSTNYLARVFSNYLPMAIGGETRYLKTIVSERQFPFPNKLVTKDVVVLLSHLPDGQSWTRYSFWIEWKNITDEYGLIPMLEACYIIHNGYPGFRGSIGGHKWATACQVLLEYLKGDISKRMFVDTAWSLEHNNRIIYDKLWSLDSLKTVLDHNLKGNMDRVAVYASPKIQSLQIRIKEGVRREQEKQEARETDRDPSTSGLLQAVQA